MSKLKTFAKQSGYTHAEVTGPSKLLLYTVEECDVCGCECSAANSVTVHHFNRADARNAGLLVMEAPEESGWSELHEAATCSECNAQLTAVAV